jgi:hypothetical protein
MPIEEFVWRLIDHPDVGLRAVPHAKEQPGRVISMLNLYVH